MTVAEDPVRLFRDALPGFARRDLSLTVEAIVDIRAAVERGHDPGELAGLVAYHTAGLDNADEVMRFRLHRYAGYDADAEFRDIARMDWLYAPTKYDKLHCPVGDYEMPDWHAENVTFACGRKVKSANIPGIFSRMSLPRCNRCCDAAGFPRGTGSPKNDNACRVLLDLPVVDPPEWTLAAPGTTPAPQRIQLRRTKGWRKPEGAVVVSRPSRWGNPFRIVPDGVGFFGNRLYKVVAHPDGLDLRRFVGGQQTHHEAASIAVKLYRDWINTQSRAENLVPLLRGRDLACWCPLDQPCHADVLLEFANGDAS